MASRETGGYCVKAIEVSSGKKCTIINLGLAMTKDHAKLFVNVGGDKVMHQIEICQVHSHSDPCAIKVFFRALYGAVHYLIKNPIIYEEPCILPFRERKTRQDIVCF